MIIIIVLIRRRSRRRVPVDPKPETLKSPLVSKKTGRKKSKDAVEKIYIDTLDPISGKIMSDPVLGNNCKHTQPLDRTVCEIY